MLKISDIEFQMQAPDFWKDHEIAGRLSKELNGLKEDVAFWDGLEKRLEEYSILTDPELEEKNAQIHEFKSVFDKQYAKIFLSGKYDRGNALLYIYSGAGGVDAQDWASMLLRMYQKYAEKNSFSFVLLDQGYGEQGGTKHAVAEIAGRYAYGYLRGESGVHRLVRMSPFSAKGLRHTSFVLVDMLPEVEDVKIDIDPKDLRVDTFRSSGPGGQNVNKLETAVRVTHIPTNTVVAVQSERSQAQNKEKAMQVLKSRLAKLMEDQKAAELSQLRYESREIEWGSQIRSYVLNPYKQVKDHRTGVESTQPDKVLDGELDEFIKAELQDQK
ncbi:MAG: peptide chain release factor 2 [Candidatus Yanofskybacteria bacterium]|nr:peptide chain release factor 2 [Candidatus Yanofskybacteria bacterium]